MPELKNYRTPSPKAIKLMRITSMLCMFFFWIVPVLILTGAIWDEAGVKALVLPGFALLIAIVYTLIAPKIRFKRYRYLIAHDRIEIIEGLIFIRRTIVPIDRIYQIDIRKGPLDSAVGVAKVVITTAGSSAAFRFLEPEAADEIAMYINETVLKKIKSKGAENDV